MSANLPVDISLSIAAISVAICALFISSGQILGQYFATADGYRRCQPSVMGPWAKLTRLRWRWSQFRFETLFTTPEILLVPFHVDQELQRIVGTSPDDEFERISGSMANSPSTENKSDELACWLPFLSALHQNEWELRRLGYYNYQLVDINTREQQQIVGPAIRLRERSWDFMPPDIVRPVAVTTLSDIATMARRLGMSWRTFRPEEGVMRAEGNGHVITSTLARSIGIVLHYQLCQHVERVKVSSPATFSRTKSSSGVALYIPSREADMMAFGILPSYNDLSIPSFRVGTFSETLAAMDIIDPTCKASETLNNIRNLLAGKWDAHYTRGFSDLIPLAAPMLRLRKSSVIRLPTPMKHCFGLTSHREGFVVFHNRLKQYITERGSNSVSNQITWVLEQYEILKATFPIEWESEVEFNGCSDIRPLAFLDAVHAAWDTATAYFIHLHNTFRLHYFDLMASHVSHAVNYWPDAWAHIRDGTTRNNYGLRSLEAEGMHMYFDYLPNVAEDMRRRGFEGKDDLVHEAWFVMMFRAFCWWRCHFLGPGKEDIEGAEILPAVYWDSEQPVYIG